MAGFDPVILPGGEGKVSVTVRTARYRGAISKAVTVYSNDPNNAKASLHIKGRILVPIEVHPSEHINLAGKVGSIEPGELFLIARQGDPFDVLSVRNALDYLRVELEPAPEKAAPRADGSAAPALEQAVGTVAGGHAAYRLQVSVADDAPIGRISDTIHLKTNHPKEPNLQIRVVGQLRGEIEVRPTTLYFRSRGSGEPTRARKVNVFRKPDGDLKILKVESSSPDFVPSTTTVQEGLEYQIEVTRPEEKLRIPAQGTLTIRTNHGNVEVQLQAR